MANKPKKKIVKQSPNFTQYDDGTIVIRNVRASYPHVDKPYKGKDQSGEASYSITGLMDKTTHTDAKNALRDMIRELLAEKKLKDIAADRKFLRDGDMTAKETDAGNWIVATRESKPPILRDEKNATVQAVDAGRKFYGGCYVDILLRPWFQDNSYGKRVNANLLAVQFKKDGEPFGEGRITEDDADDVFEGVGDDESGFSAGGDDDEL